MADNTDNQKLIEQAQKQTKKYVKFLEKWIPKRLATAKRLREIASDLQKWKEDANISRVVCSIVGVGGGIAALVGTVMTGCLSAPIFIAGLAIAFTGTATSTGTGIAEYFISKSKLKSAQEVLEDDNKLTKIIEDERVKLDDKVEELSNILRRSTQEVFGALLMSTSIERGCGLMSESMVFNILVSDSARLVCKLRSSFQSGSVIGKVMKRVFSDVSLNGLSRVLGTVLKGVAAGAMLGLDIYFLVTNSIELSKGSRSGAADSLTKIATKLEEHAHDLETVLERIREETEECIMSVCD